MLVFLVFLIALLLGFKFYPKLTKIVAVAGIIFGITYLIAGAYYFTHRQNQALGASTVNSITFPSISPTPFKTDCVIDGNDYQMTAQQCHHAMSESMAKLGREINQENIQVNQDMANEQRIGNWAQAHITP